MFRRAVAPRLVSACALATVCVGAAHAAPYRLVQLDDPNTELVQYILTGVNDSDQIVGSRRTGFFDHAFIKGTSGYVQIPPAPGSNEGIINGINNSGVAVGTFDTLESDDPVEGRFADSGIGFVYHGGTVTTFLDPLGTNGTYPSGINNHGQIVGYYVPDAGGHVRDGFLLSDGAFTTLDDPAGDLSTTPVAINDNGVIVGRYVGNTKAGGFVYQNGAFTNFNVPGAIDTFPGGINNLGEIVGTYLITPGGDMHGFLYDDDTFLSLSLPADYFLFSLSGINNHRDIVGSYVHAGGYHGFVLLPTSNALTTGAPVALTAVPEPSGWSLFAGGLLIGAITVGKRAKRVRDHARRERCRGLASEDGSH